MGDLTLKQERFINAYLGEAAGNGVQAARLAGYSGNDNVLHVTASRLLQQPTIRTRVQETRRDLGITRERIMRGLLRVAEDDRANNGIAAVKAYQLLGAEEHGMFKPVQEQRDSEVRIIVVRESLPPVDRIQIASNTAVNANASAEPGKE